MIKLELEMSIWEKLNNMELFQNKNYIFKYAT